MKADWNAASISEFLGSHLEIKKKRNSAYSMRAFARDVGLSPSRLSEILNGKEGISEKVGAVVAKKLGLKAQSKIFWMDLVRSECSRSSVIRKSAKKRIEEFKKTKNVKIIEDDQFKLISDWQHAAILELITLENISHDPPNLAARLGITVSQAESAIERLITLKFIKKNIDNKLVSTPDLSASTEGVPSMAIRKFHRQILEKAILSTVEDETFERELNSVILAIPRSRLPEFRQKIQGFFLEFIQSVGDEQKDDLFALSVQFFPIKKRGRS